MAGGRRKRNYSKKERNSDGEQNNGGDEHSNEPNSNSSANATPVKKSKKSSKKAKNSPRKAGKCRRGASVTRGSQSAQIRFEEDGNEVIVDIDGLDTREFPSEGDTTLDSEPEEDLNNNATLTRTIVNERNLLSGDEEEEGELISPEEIRCTKVTDLLRYSKAKKRKQLYEKNGKGEEVQPMASNVEVRPSTSTLTSEELINQAVCRTMERMEEIFQARAMNGSFGAAPPATGQGLENLRLDQIQVPAQNARGRNERGTERQQMRNEPGNKGVKGRELKDSDVRNSISGSDSEVTIYQRAVPPEDPIHTELNQNKEVVKIGTCNRDSTSSEEAIDTSDEMLEINANGPELFNNHDLILPGNGPSNGYERRQMNRQDQHGFRTDYRGHQSLQNEPANPDQIAQERADFLIRQAEANKAQMLEVPGNEGNIANQEQSNEGNGDCLHYVVDEKYLVIGNYVEDSLRQKIENGEYVDFSKLLPRDRVAFEEDQRMELVNRDGHTYFIPARGGAMGSENSISNFLRWEQAFRVYSNIYTSKNPSRASELIQYNHIIHTASMAFHWDNVYLYDKEFRIHMAMYPRRSWAIILQQAWTMRMRDRIIRRENFGRQGGKKFSKRDVCWRYNKGKCTYGNNCKFEHRCSECNKFGHGAHICRRANGGGGDRPERNPNNPNNRKDDGDRDNFRPSGPPAPPDVKITVGK